VIGLAAESVAFGWTEPRRWLPDLAVGWTFIGLGLVASDRWPENRTGPLLALTGFGWFVGNFAAADLGIVALLAGQTAFLYRGLLAHLLLAYPTGRLPDNLTRGVVLLAYAGALVGPFRSGELGAIGLGAFLLAASTQAYVRSVGAPRRARALALRACTALALVLIGWAAANLIGGAGVAAAAALGYQLALCGLAIGLFVGLVGRSWERAEVTDLVVGLSEGQSGTLRGELASALGDPSLKLGYWVAEVGEYVDVDGRVVILPPGTSGRAVTLIGQSDVPVAALVHDPALLDDPGLLESVASAARLAASNITLQAELQLRIAELVASRRRLLEAGDEERRRLEVRLRDGAQTRLEELGRLLALAASGASGVTASEAITSSQAQLERTRDELGRLASGLHPRTLSEQGLAEALRALTNDFPFRVRFELPAEPLPAHVETVTYFVVSEALANVAKHASASQVSVSIATDTRYARIGIEDDGRGGADPRGSGLRGLSDRVEALGGTLRVDSPHGMGTRVTADIPLDGTTS
jgi:signal transduction histidine kinase